MSVKEKASIHLDEHKHFAVNRDELGEKALVTCNCGYVGFSDENYSRHSTKQVSEASSIEKAIRDAREANSRWTVFDTFGKEALVDFAHDVLKLYSEDERHIVKERLKEKIEAIPECDCDDCAEGASAFAKGQRDMKRNIINEILQED